VVYNLVPASRGRAGSALLAGVPGAALVAVLGNLDGALQLGEGLLARLAAAPVPPFDYWRSSRMLPPSFAITEFPFFTFLVADLHAHLLALPYTLLAIGLTVAVALDRGPPGWAGVRHQAPGLLALGLVLGALRGINSWDFPTYLLLAGAGLAIGEHAGRGRLAAATLGWIALKLAGLYALSYLLFLPFHQNYELFYKGVTPSPERTPLYQYVLIHGLFLFLALSLLAGELRHSPLGQHPGRAVALAGAAMAGALALGVAGWSTVGFLALLLIGVAVLVLTRLGSPYRWHRPRLVVLALIALAAGLGIGVDLVTLEGDIVRMNTVFKFYLQGWVLWALAAAYALWWVGRRVAGWPRPSRALWLGGLALLLAAAAIYPVLGTRARLADRFQVLPPTLDGMAYMKSAIYYDKPGPIELVWDYQAIRWLRDNLQGSPVIVEGVTPLYRWGSRVSVYTGLPTVVGWDWHQKQQRWGYRWMVEVRQRDVNQLYTTTNPALARSILKKYGVRYVYIGPVERLYYPRGGLAKFEGMADLELVYSNPQVKIYRVAG